MEVIIYVLLGVISFLAALGLIHVTNYNRLQSKKIKINEAESVIDEMLRVRYDLVIRICNIIKTSLSNSGDYFKGFEDLKSTNISNFEFDRKISGAVNLIFQVKDDNHVLEDNKDIQAIIKELKETEEKLEAAKIFYNKYTTELNNIIKVFPSNITARIHGFVVKPFFDGKNLEDDIIDDFKL